MQTKGFEYKLLILFFVILLPTITLRSQVVCGAEQIPLVTQMLKDKKVILAVNPTSMVGKTHLVDTLKKCGIKITSIFAPEHGFRGDFEAGAHVKNSKDPASGIQVISLYGDHRKPTSADLKNADVVVFDIQDVGVRFYTYLGTLHYIMEACAENKKPLIILDRPNPNGDYVDGPVLDMKYKSFVGMHPVPVVHGLTVGEYAQMINGQGWLKDSLKCSISIVKLKNYNHETMYKLPVKPSPNLPTYQSVRLYASLCLFEGTTVSLGRGTDKPFECFGKPGYFLGSYTFTPRSIKGVADKPLYMNVTCNGHLLTSFAETVMSFRPRFYINWLIDMYKADTSKSTFFIPFFDQLAGSDVLRKQIIAGMDEKEIRQSWQADLKQYHDIRRKYLLYPDFDKSKMFER